MTPSSLPRLFCFGLGYTASALAATLAGEGWRIAGTVRSPERVASLARRGIEVHLFDRGRPLGEPEAALAGTTHILVSAPPDELGDAVLDAHEADLAALECLQWVGYLSTTGVYGDHKGEWVDESSELRPSSPRALRRVAAEDAWLDVWHRYGIPVQVFRLAGIYGPGRSALDQVRAGTVRRIDKPGQVFGRIHVDDIVQVLRASIARPNPGAIYNLADDEPAPPAEVVAHACRLLGVEPPPLVPFEKAELSPMARSFYDGNRRVRNERIKEELGVTLRYPDYRSGLAACLTAAPGS